MNHHTPFIRKIIPVLFILCTGYSFAQKPAGIKEYNKIYPTYPFSDPDPIADPGSNIYPYFRFDGFTDKAIQKEWKVVELENDYIRITILPQIGGKIWNAVEKSTGKSFIYNNHVIKFRDVAMRGPWTSGGIEANYGIIGHTPNCATPVDYTTITKPDGSVSCIIGVLDLLSGTQWRLDINLQKDKAYFTTSSFWYNATPLEQPYYSWMNTGIPAKGNLQFIYPGTHYLGHEGEYNDWPINKQNGKDISFYENNNFGGYKSYHVFGKYTDFFGAYWHDEDFGMGRFSRHDDKAGKKIWIWGLSQQGMIWEKLLTDTDGQYVEVQSGKLFNQSAEGSTLTPFKHRGFAPYASDNWTEYWFPVKQTKGFVKANDYGALNIKKEHGHIKLFFSPLQDIDDNLNVMDGAKLIYSGKVQLHTMQVFEDSIAGDANMDQLTVSLGENKFLYQSGPSTANLDRPLETPADFDWNSVFGLYTQGKEDIRQRHYNSAVLKLTACLAKDPNYAPALVEMGALHYRNMHYTDALVSLKKALSIDTYDAAANFYYGLVNIKLGYIDDARDGFDIAAQNAEFRSAAYIELAKVYLQKPDLDKALEYAEDAARINQNDINALHILAVIRRLQKNEVAATVLLNRIVAIDPLDHFAGFEKYLWHPSETTEKNLRSLITNEMPQEIFTDLGIAYYGYHCKDDAIKVFALSPQTTETVYWRAFLENKKINGENKADSLTAFPFRAETATVLDSLIKNNTDWKLKYQLALIWWSRNDTAKANALFVAIGDQPSYAPYYAGLAALFPIDAEKNLQKAITLDQQQWRYPKLLANYYLAQGENKKALATIEPYYTRHASNYIVGMLYAKTLLLNNEYARTDALLTKLNIIPFEGATDGRRLYHEAKLMQCIGEIKKGHYQKALAFVESARQWPVNLGVGKPYQPDIDERLENWLAYTCYMMLSKKTQALQALESITSFIPKRENTVSNYFSANTLVHAWALRAMNKNEQALQLLNQWQQKNPADKTAEWANNVFKEQTASAPQSIQKNDETVRLLVAFLRSGEEVGKSEKSVSQ